MLIFVRIIYRKDVHTLPLTTILANSWKLSQHGFDQELEVAQIILEK